jgi:ATP-dependent exoDNAse (exonuclease V) beta subunit
MTLDAEGAVARQPDHAARRARGNLRSFECRQAAAWLARQMAEHGLEPKDVMVLARKRDRLSVMQEVLRGMGMPDAAAREGRPGRSPRGAGRGGAARCAGVARP